MGFLDYAWSISFQKDNRKVKILQDPNSNQPTMSPDSFGYTLKFPAVQFLENKKIAYMGQTYDANNTGKSKIGRLFRASVLHLTTHTLAPLPQELIAPNPSEGFTQAFAKATVRDVIANAYLQAWYPDRFIDIAYANAMAYMKIKPAERIFSPSTRVMTGMLTRINVGSVKGTLKPEEEQAVEAMFQECNIIRDTYLGTLAGDEVNLEELFNTKVKTLKEQLEPFGPFLEAPSLRHTENIGRCSIYTEAETNTCNNRFQ